MLCFPVSQWSGHTTLSVEAGERIEQLRDAAVRTRGAGSGVGMSPVTDLFNPIFSEMREGR